ncbi:hypothetical protein KKD20_03375, partial [Patescibacteria group bacterium]|nr:hypothetical protein [Patescibacteria group bacterium]
MPNVEQQSNIEGGDGVGKEAEEKIELTPEQERAKQRMIYHLSKGDHDIYIAFSIKKEFNLSNEITNELAKQAMIKSLLETWTGSAINIKRLFFNSNDKIIKSPEIQEAAKSGMIKGLLTKTWFNDALRIKENFLSDEIAGEVCKQVMIKDLGRGNIDNAIKIKEKFNLPEEAVQDAAKQEMIRRLDDGMIDYAVEIKEKFNLPEEIITSPEIQDAAKQGMIVCFRYGNINDTLRIKEEFKLPDQELAQGIEEIIKQEKLLPILTNLDVIPESVLRLLENKYFLLTYKQNLALASEKIYNQYRKFKQEGDEVQLAGFIEKIRSQTESLISNEPQSSEISKQEYYQDLIRAVYPNHAESRTDYENNESCPDRSGDLEKFEIKDVYEIDLREGVEMEMKPSQEKDEKGLTQLEKPIAEIQQKFSQVEFDKEKMF